jgi:hypothetical protein
MAISLGRNVVVTWDGVTVPGVRDVQVSVAGTTREITPFGSRHTFSYHTGYGVSISIDTIDDAAATTAIAAAIAGTEIAVVTNGYSFSAVVTNVSDSQPLDDARVWSIQMTKTQAGLRT